MKFILGLVIAGALWTNSVFADPDTGTRRYAALSLLGDSLTIVTYQPAVGSYLDSNLHQSYPLPNSSLDRTALVAINDALVKIDPQTQTILLALAPSRVNPEFGNFEDGQQFDPGATLDQALKQQSATHLVLVTKYRGQADLAGARESMGSGELEGIGFYMDHLKWTTRFDDGGRGKGFLAPYAYFKVSLIDLATSTVLRHQLVTSGIVYSSARSQDSANAWDALNASEKMKVLGSLITRGIADAVPALVKASEHKD
jgi:hypothetical protein